MVTNSVDFESLSKADLERWEILLQIRDRRVDFATNHHLNTAGRRMDFDSHPHIREIYNCLAPVIVIQGSVQSLKSEWSIIDHLACASLGLQVFYVLPKYETREEYVQNRVNKVVSLVTRYKSIMSKGSFDNIAIKMFGDGVIRYVGSNVIGDFKEFPADVLFVDEVDRCHTDNLEYAHDRLRASKFQFKRYIGNPEIAGVGVNKLYEQSSRGEWYIPCIHCGTYHAADWFNTVVEAIRDLDDNVIDYKLRDSEWRPGSRRDICMICPTCGGVLDRFSKEGHWWHRSESSIVGYHISMLCSPFNPIADMWEKFRVAQHDLTAMTQFYNSYLGLPFTAQGSRLTESLLIRASEIKSYDFVTEGAIGHIPNDFSDGPCTMGVDVGNALDVRISQVIGRKRKAVFIGKVKTKEELLELEQRYNVELAIIDSMPEPTLSEDFQDEASCTVWTCRYTGDGKDTRVRRNTKEMSLGVDRTSALDRAFAALKTGNNLIPSNFRDLCDGEYVKEMTGPVRQVSIDSAGNSKFTWSKCQDHSRHADSYDHLAATMLSDLVIEDAWVG